MSDLEASSAVSLPYHPISRHYKTTFGEKVYKIPVTVAATCPNREGLNGMKTCNFCDAWGSAAYPDLQKDTLEAQIAESQRRVLSRVNAAKFLIYFQAYTTTFSRVAKLREFFEVALNYPGVVGVVVGTRPDCLSDALIDLLNEYSEKMYVSVELGVQSFNDETLIWMRRGHSAKRSIDAVHRLREKCPNINLGIHLMFGAPGETDAEIISSAQISSALPIHNVKLHNLHVLINTPLADDFARGEYRPLTRDEYTERVILFLQHLRPDISVHRLAALSSRSEELVAPEWTAKKMETYQFILDKMNSLQAWQGQFWRPVSVGSTSETTYA